MKIYYLLICAICMLAPTAETVVRSDANDTERTEPRTSVRTQGQVVARVNGEIITDRQVSIYIKQFQIDFKTALQLLIGDKVIFQAGVKAKLKTTPEIVDAGIKERISRIGTIEQFQKQVLDVINLSMDDYRQMASEDLLRQQYIQSKIGTPPADKSSKDVNFIINPFVAPSEIRDYFAKNKAEFVIQEKIKTRQIIIKFDNNNKDERKDKAERILAELNKSVMDVPAKVVTETFSALAKKHSEVKADTGGEWDWTPKGSFPKEVEDIIYTLAVGKTSPIIETGPTFRIIMVEDKTVPKEPDIDDPQLQDQIKLMLRQQKINDGIEALKIKLVREADIHILR